MINKPSGQVTFLLWANTDESEESLTCPSMISRRQTPRAPSESPPLKARHFRL